MLFQAEPVVPTPITLLPLSYKILLPIVLAPVNLAT